VHLTKVVVPRLCRQQYGRRSALSLSATPIPEPTRCRPRGRVTVRAYVN